MQERKRQTDSDEGREAMLLPFWFLVDASGVSISEHSLCLAPLLLFLSSWLGARSCSTHRGRSVADSRNRFASLSVLAACRLSFSRSRLPSAHESTEYQLPCELIALVLYEFCLGSSRAKSIGLSTVECVAYWLA